MRAGEEGEKSLRSRPDVQWCDSQSFWRVDLITLVGTCGTMQIKFSWADSIKSKEIWPQSLCHVFFTPFCSPPCRLHLMEMLVCASAASFVIYSGHTERVQTDPWPGSRPNNHICMCVCVCVWVSMICYVGEVPAFLWLETHSFLPTFWQLPFSREMFTWPVSLFHGKHWLLISLQPKKRSCKTTNLDYTLRLLLRLQSLQTANAAGALRTEICKEFYTGWCRLFKSRLMSRAVSANAKITLN